MRKIVNRLIFILAISLFLSLLVLFLPLPGQMHTQMALYVMVSLLHIDIAILYVSGLKGFKSQFKIGYWYIACAMVAYAVAILILPFMTLIQATNEDSSPLSSLVSSNYLIAVPFFFYLILYYLGVRKIGQVMALEGRSLSRRFVISVSVVVGFLSALIPLPALGNDVDPVTLHILFGIVGTGLSLLLASMIVIFRLSRNVSPLYKKAFAWNFYGFLVFFVLQLLDPTAFLPADHWYTQYGTTLPFLLSAICFTAAAFEFNRIPLAEQQLLTRGSQGDLQGATLIDVIVSVAGLVSNPKTIDPDLDRLRNITSSQQGNTPLTEAQQMEMVQIYKKIEDYLVQKEQARKYTREGLRQLIEIKYHATVKAATFWRELEI